MTSRHTDSTLFTNRQLLLLLAAFLSWQGLRALRKGVWILFGLATMLFWSGMHGW